MIKFPNFIKDDWMMVPTEVGVFNKEESDTKMYNGTMKEPEVKDQPPRIFMIRQSWTLIEVFFRCMSHFCKFVPNSNAIAPLNM